MAMRWKNVRKLVDRDVLLKRLGLEERSPASDVFTGLGLFSLGVLVGAGLGLMFAPRRGEEIRAAINEAWRSRGRVAQDFQREMGVEGAAPPAPGH